jgi:uncharacterized protein
VSDHAESAPRWPAWYAPVAFVVVVGVTTVIAGILLAITNTKPDDNSAAVTIVGTLIQAGAFIGTAVLFASFVDKPRPWQFGLRRTRFWPAVGWAALGLFAFYLFAIVYSAAVNPDVKQTVTQELGADQGTAGLIVAGVVVIVVAPIAEEFFFRGFFFGALRRWRIKVAGREIGVWVAAVVTGILFGLAHTGSASPQYLVPLGFLGFVLCIVRWRTGSLYPCMALHSINNSLALGVNQVSWNAGEVFALMAASLLVIGAITLPLSARVPALRWGS